MGTIGSDLGTPPPLAPAVRQTISGREYSCLINDHGVLLYDETNENTRYEADLTSYLPLLTPQLTKAGKVKVPTLHSQEGTAMVERTVRISWSPRQRERTCPSGSDPQAWGSRDELLHEGSFREDGERVFGEECRGN